MNESEIVEAIKILSEKLMTESMRPLLERDKSYIESSEENGKSEIEYIKLNLTDEQKKVCDRYIESIIKSDLEYSYNAYLAGISCGVLISDAFKPILKNGDIEKQIKEAIKGLISQEV